MEKTINSKYNKQENTEIRNKEKIIKRASCLIGVLRDRLISPPYVHDAKVTKEGIKNKYGYLCSNGELIILNDLDKMRNLLITYFERG